MRRGWVFRVVLVAVAAGLAGCGGAPVTSARAARPVVALPPGVQDPARIPAAVPAPDCDPRASLRPPARMPAPGRMPAGSTMARIAARGYLIAGVDQNKNLFGFIRDGELAGFDIDFVHAIAAAMLGDPDKVQFRAISSADRISSLNSGRVDLVADSMTITCDRLQQVAMSTDYFDSGQKIMVRRGSPYRSIADLGGAKVCAPTGTTSINTIAGQRPAPIPVAVVDWTDCLVLLQQGYADAISTTDSVLLGLVAQDPTTVVRGPRFTDEPHGFAVRRSQPDLIRFVNGVLERMRADGRWRAEYVRWLTGLDPVVPAPPAARYLG
ncbi:MAG TPA: glutamate ABC transporter substrate-binding protein [Mycobacteriales bacterium]|nr:glutamate ABC transporter substrate-binding protein [Mycobacteriales bacterium]